MTILETIEHEALVELRLNRPDKRNAVDDALLTTLADAVENLAADPTHALLLSGNGPVTCAGRDLAAVQQDDYDLHERQSGLMSALRSYPLPTAVAAKGALIGFGFGLQLQCDLLVVGKDTTLSLPEVDFDVDVSHRLPPLADIIGPRVATEMVLRGHAIDGPRAFELGLANEVVPEDAVDERARTLLAEIMDADAEILRSILTTARGR
ncbi:MAG: enoyl-CoA hydratase/isomerase family protein [Salinirussus sp.]